MLSKLLHGRCLLQTKSYTLALTFGVFRGFLWVISRRYDLLSLRKTLTEGILSKAYIPSAVINKTNNIGNISAFYFRPCIFNENCLNKCLLRLFKALIIFNETLLYYLLIYIYYNKFIYSFKKKLYLKKYHKVFGSFAVSISLSN